MPVPPSPQADFCPPFPKEVDALRQRREAAGLGPVEPDQPLNPVGLALSGGGIRSATFSLGVLQGLARLGLLKHVDYLSTVSGGGYIGAYLGGLFCPRAGEPGFAAPEVEAGLRPGADPGLPVARTLGWLRENGRYLTPGGSGDGVLAAVTLLRNWAAVMVVMGLFALTAWMALDLLQVIRGGSLGREVQSLSVRGLTLWLSPWWQVLPFLLLPAIGAGWAYFLVGYRRDGGANGLWERLWRRPWWISLMAAGLGLGGIAYGQEHPQAWPTGLTAALGLLYGGGLSALGAWLITCRTWEQTAEWRRRLAVTLRGVGWVAAVLAGIALVDSLGWTLAHRMPGGPPPANHPGLLETVGGSVIDLFLGEKGTHGLFLTGLGALTGLLKLHTGTLRPDEGSVRRLLRAVALPILALSLGALVLGLLSAVAHRMWFAVPGGLDAQQLPDSSRLWIFGATLLLTWVAGRVLGFLNQSTLGPFYTSALTRAYLGASNPQRWREGRADPQRLPADDLPGRDYRPWLRGGPLPLFNVTLNETTGGRSQVVQRDRKGMNLAVGAAGLSVGVRHHAAWLGEDRLQRLAAAPDGPGVWPLDPVLVEPLTIGQWVGISGAAVSTGLGDRTRLSTSLLAGLFNVRLGYWWRPGTHRGGQAGTYPTRSPWRRGWEAAFPVQARLLEEWMGLFPGTDSTLWNLTDGGHFENTGAYELVRRRLPLVLLSDNGQDPDSALENLANLVAKARTDFQTEIRFLDEGELTGLVGTGPGRRAFGTLTQLLDPKHTAVATAAWLQYPTGAPGLLVVLKPTLAPDLPLDLRDYARQHPAFPQETTGDQFFDERQWESYRKLGEAIATAALGDGLDGPATWLRSRLDA